jgi:hypothetical protein
MESPARKWWGGLTRNNAGITRPCDVASYTPRCHGPNGPWTTGTVSSIDGYYGRLVHPQEMPRYGPLGQGQSTIRAGGELGSSGKRAGPARF